MKARKQASWLITAILLIATLSSPFALNGHALADDYGYSVRYHADGGGVTYNAGNEKRVEYADGSWSHYVREGNWEYRRHSSGVFEAWFYDDLNQVSRFDIRNPNTGVREIGENPYPTNPFAVTWSRRLPL
jgi:hypothetical protein